MSARWKSRAGLSILDPAAQPFEQNFGNTRDNPDAQLRDNPRRLGTFYQWGRMGGASIACCWGRGRGASRPRRAPAAARAQSAGVRGDARRDLAFFFPVFLFLLIAGTIEMGAVLRHVLAVALLIVYASYAVVMLRLKRVAGAKVGRGLYFESILRGNPLDPRGFAIAAQVTVGVLAILIGAVEFVDQIVVFSAHAHLNPGVLSLMLSPLATELPEKYNSVVWIRDGKDHLDRKSV